MKAVINEYTKTKGRYLCIEGDAGAQPKCYFIMKTPIPILEPSKMKPLSEDFDVKNY